MITWPSWLTTSVMAGALAAGLSTWGKTSNEEQTAGRPTRRDPVMATSPDHRLKLHYKHFSFGIKNIKYGKAVIQSLVPQTYDSAPVRNPDPHPLTTTITREVSSTRSVTHTTTSSWSNSHELGVTIGYQPPETGTN